MTGLGFWVLALVFTEEVGGIGDMGMGVKERSEDGESVGLTSVFVLFSSLKAGDASLKTK